MQFAIITTAIYLFCITTGFVYTWLVLFTNIFKKHDIQQRQRRKELFIERMPLIGLNLTLLLVLAMFGSYMISDWFVLDGLPWYIGVAHFAILIVVDDVFFYFYHRYMHVNPYLYRKIHRIHHKAIQPFPLEFIYGHPLEWSLGTLGIVVALIGMHFVGPVSAYGFWAYTAFRNLHELEIHSSLRSAIGQWIPFFGTTEHHDKHHSHVHGNYASTFTLLDKIFKTEVKG